VAGPRNEGKPKGTRIEEILTNGEGSTLRHFVATPPEEEKGLRFRKRHKTEVTPDEKKLSRKKKVGGIGHVKS